MPAETAKSIAVRAPEGLCPAALTHATTWRTTCRYKATTRGVDGQFYCRRHAEILERRLDEWGERVATLEGVLGVPHGLPETKHAEWREHRRNFMYAEANDVDLADQIFALTRLHQMRRDCA